MSKIWLYKTVFVSGFVVMSVELAGARLMSPYFGVGIYVWAALISVTLSGLAAGYWVGGILADKRPNWFTFYLIVLLPAIPLLLIPLAHKSVSTWSAKSLGVAYGSLLSTFTLFTAPLFILGMVSPFAVKMASERLSILGRTTGRLYGISTAGGLLGTLITAFLLIPTLGISRIFFLSASLLAAVTLVGWLINGIKKHHPSALIIIAVSISATIHSSSLPQGVLFSKDSLYGRVEVREREKERLLLIDGYIHSTVSTEQNGEEIKCEYVRTFALLYEFMPKAKIGLLVGYGAGLINRILGRYDITFDVVEINPVVLKASKKFFGHPKHVRDIFLQDGRNYIRNTERVYDVVAIDVISADSVPVHLFSREFFSEVKRILAPDGVVAINSMGNINGKEFPAIYRTLKEVFPHIRTFYAHKTETFTNLIFFASETPLIFREKELAKWWRKVEMELPEDGILLTDEKNILDILSAQMGITVRESTLKYLSSTSR